MSSPLSGYQGMRGFNWNQAPVAEEGLNALKDRMSARFTHYKLDDLMIKSLPPEDRSFLKNLSKIIDIVHKAIGRLVNAILTGTWVGNDAVKSRIYKDVRELDGELQRLSGLLIEKKGRTPEVINADIEERRAIEELLIELLDDCELLDECLPEGEDKNFFEEQVGGWIDKASRHNLKRIEEENELLIEDVAEHKRGLREEIEKKKPKGVEKKAAFEAAARERRTAIEGAKAEIAAEKAEAEAAERARKEQLRFDLTEESAEDRAFRDGLEDSPFLEVHEYLDALILPIHYLPKFYLLVKASQPTTFLLRFCQLLVIHHLQL